jgi:L-ascorbate metabolism protein UlaG (beta-lactamase superfamily)
MAANDSSTGCCNQAWRSCLLQNILIDPWLSGTQTDYTSWLSKQWHATEPRVPSIAAVEDLIHETESLASGLRPGKGRRSSVQSTDGQDEVETFIDAVAISHQFTDHCHEQTMRTVHPNVPVFATEVSRSIFQVRRLLLMGLIESDTTD